MLWHSDSSFRPVPAKYSLLSARVVNPKGGNTEFADMRAAYDALDAQTRALIEDLVCEHSLMYSRGSLGFLDYTEEERAMFRPVRQRLVRTHPVTGRRSLYLSSHAGAIVGMPMPEARILLRDLTEHATQPRFVYVHRWQPWDLVMWDNRQVMHRVRRYDDTHVARLRFIRHCRALDLSLDEIRTLLQLRDAPQEDCAEVNAVIDEHLEHVAQRIRELKQLQAQLRELRVACSQPGAGRDCGILGRLEREVTADTAKPVRGSAAHGGSVHRR